MANTKIPPELVDDQVFGRRNVVINGAMTVAQRGTSATTMTSGGVFLIDRFKCIESSNGAATVEQSTDTPAGFAKSLKLDVTTADTDMGGGQYSQIKYVVEAQDLQRLNYGTSDAETITLSFWVKSSKTGTYCISIVKHDSTSYFYVKEYTISSANTWEKKTITITPTAGSTTLITNSAGAIADDNGAGLQLGWFLSAGTTYNGATNDAWSSNSNHFATSNQVNWMDSTSNDFYLTGVQLEVGDNATPFEHLTTGEELALCQRYFVSTAYPNNFQATHGVGGNENAAFNTDGYWLYQGISYYDDGYAHDQYQLPVSMRARPTPTPYAPNGLVSGYTGGSTKLAAYGLTGGAEWRAADVTLFTWAGTPACSSFRVDYGSTDEDMTEGMWIGGFEFDAEL